MVPGIRDTEDRRVIAFKEHDAKIKETEATGVHSLSKNISLCVPMSRSWERGFKELAHMMWRLGVGGQAGDPGRVDVAAPV